MEFWFFLMLELGAFSILAVILLVLALILTNYKCWLIVIYDLIKYRVWSPHLYEEIERHKGNIFTTDYDFREADSMEHEPGEIYHANVTIITCRCRYCGKEIKEWCDGSEIRL